MSTIKPIVFFNHNTDSGLRLIWYKFVTFWTTRPHCLANIRSLLLNPCCYKLVCVRFRINTTINNNGMYSCFWIIHVVRIIFLLPVGMSNNCLNDAMFNHFYLIVLLFGCISLKPFKLRDCTKNMYQSDLTLCLKLFVTTFCPKI